MSASALLEVRDLRTQFPVSSRGFFCKPLILRAVDGVNFTISAHESFGLVGESGCGKSTTAMSVLRLVEVHSGQVLFDGENILTYTPRQMRQVRRRIQVVFQDPYSSLNPKWRIGQIVREPLEIQNWGTRTERDERVSEMLALVGLRPEHARRYPNEFSGGQRQRIAIARALSTKPELVVCDEIVSALDVAIQAKILNLMAQLQQQLGVAFLFISHDLSVVYHLCENVGVMYLGRIVEQGPVEAVFTRPLHPYTQVLIDAVPRRDRHSEKSRESIIPEGDPPNPLNIPGGCRFAGRCPFSVDQCHSEEPPVRRIGVSLVACHRVSDEGVRHWFGESASRVEASVPAGSGSSKSLG